jgi:hypothetical protein
MCAVVLKKQLILENENVLQKWAGFMRVDALFGEGIFENAF